jgi:hypothetical protein
VIGKYWGLGTGYLGLGNQRGTKNMLKSKLFKKTILHTWHTAHHANMAPFGGYDMPLWYDSAKNIRPERTARQPINEML